MKATEIPTFGSATRSLSKNKETTASTSPLSRTSSKADSTAKPDLDVCGVAREVVTGKGRQFHFSIYKWPNKGVPVVIWGSSRLSSMAKAHETKPSDLRSTSVEKAGEDEEGESGLSGFKEEKMTSQKGPGVQTEEEKTEIGSMSEQAREANVKPLDDKDNRQGLVSTDRYVCFIWLGYIPFVDLVSFFVIAGEDIVSEREVRKGKSKAKNTQSSTGDSRTKKKPQGTKSSWDSPILDKSSFASSSSAPEVGKDGVKRKVMDFGKIFSQGPSVGAGGESIGQSSIWRAKENIPGTDINKDGANANETVNIHDQQKKSTPDIPAMVLNPQIKILIYVTTMFLGL